MSAMVQVRPQGLLTVPAEVRKMIYKELWKDTVIYLRFHLYEGWEAIKAMKGPEGLNLLQSCRTINSEALPVLLPCCRLIVVEDLSSQHAPSKQLWDLVSGLKQSAHPRKLPTRILQAFPHVKQLNCRMDHPQISGQFWFPLQNHLACLPNIETLFFFDRHMNASAPTCPGGFPKFGILGNKGIYQDPITELGMTRQSCRGSSQEDEDLLQQYEVDSLVDHVFQKGMSLKHHEQTTLLNAGNISAEDLDILHSHLPWILFTYDRKSHTFAELEFRLGFDTELNKAAVFLRKERFILRKSGRNQEEQGGIPELLTMAQVMLKLHRFQA